MEYSSDFQKKNQKITTCNQLHLETLGLRPIVSTKLMALQMPMGYYMHKVCGSNVGTSSFTYNVDRWIGSPIVSCR